MIEGCVKSDTSREKLKGNKEVYSRSDGRQELRSCIHSVISQAANGLPHQEAAHSFDLIYVYLISGPSL